MTPEERFERIESILAELAERQAIAEARQAEAEAKQTASHVNLDDARRILVDLAERQSIAEARQAEAEAKQTVSHVNLDDARRILVDLAERQSVAELRQADTEEKLNAFITSVHELEDDFRDQNKQLLASQVLMQGKMAELAEAQKESQARINMLIDFVMKREKS